MSCHKHFTHGKQHYCVCCCDCDCGFWCWGALLLQPPKTNGPIMTMTITITKKKNAIHRNKQNRKPSTTVLLLLFVSKTGLFLTILLTLAATLYCSMLFNHSVTQLVSCICELRTANCKLTTNRTH